MPQKIFRFIPPRNHAREFMVQLEQEDRPTSEPMWVTEQVFMMLTDRFRSVYSPDCVYSVEDGSEDSAPCWIIFLNEPLQPI